MRRFGATSRVVNYTCSHCGAIISVQETNTPPKTCALCGEGILSGKGFIPSQDQIRMPRR